MNQINIQGTRVIDLSQTIESGIPLPIGFPDPQIEFLREQKKGDVINVERITMGLHTATHVDAPFHFLSGYPTIDQLEPDRLIGSAVVVDLSSKKGSVPIEAKDLEQWEKTATESIQPGDAVLLYTGHSRYWKLGQAGDDFWRNGWPYLTRSSVDYLVKKQIRLVGVESEDLDLVDPYDLSKAEFPAHRTFLAKGILIIENLTNLDKIAGKRCQLIAAPLKIKGATGSPVRVLAVI